MKKDSDKIAFRNAIIKILKQKTGVKHPNPVSSDQIKAIDACYEYIKRTVY